MKRLLIVCVCVCVTKIVIAQEFNDSVYLHLYNYQIITDELKITDIDIVNKTQLKTSFHIQDLVRNTNSEQFKIYIFYNLIYSGANISFLIIDESKIKIYDLFSYSMLINSILDKPINEGKNKILWIKEILKVLERINDTNIENATFAKQYGSYIYFIPIKNIKNDGIIRQH